MTCGCLIKELEVPGCWSLELLTPGFDKRKPQNLDKVTVRAFELLSSAKYDVYHHLDTSYKTSLKNSDNLLWSHRMLFIRLYQEDLMLIS